MLKNKKIKKRGEQYKHFYEWAEDRFRAHEVEFFLDWAHRIHGIDPMSEMTSRDYLCYEKEFLS
jgi:hypothetical protein